MTRVSDLHEISEMIGGLRADARRILAWMDRHEEADQRRFEELNEKVQDLQMLRAEARGGWKVTTVVAGLVTTVVTFVYQWFGPFFFR